MKVIFQFSIALTLLLPAFYGCQKDQPTSGKFTPATPDAPATTNSTEMKGDTAVTKFDNGIVVYDYPAERMKPNEKDFCCDVYADGYAINSGNCTGATMYFFRTKFTVSGATAYRYRVTLFRNTYLVMDTYGSQSSGNCSYYGLTILYTQGQCSGDLSITVSTEYQLGGVWYTCDADHMEFPYYPLCANPCE